MSLKTALVVGAAGIIGHAVLQEAQRQDGWRAIGLARRGAPLGFPANEWISADLSTGAGLAEAGLLSKVTHVFYAAYAPNTDLAAEAQQNGKMLSNLLDSLKAHRAPLERVVLYQGCKVYGLHLGPVKTPMRETDPRHMPPNFYFTHEDILVDRSGSEGWEFTILRPDVVFGALPGQPLNLAMNIAAYGAFCHAYKVPFRFPGTQKAYDQLVQATDAGLLAEVSFWAATSATAAGESYNVTNGDLFRWANIWPWLAEKFGLDSGPPMAINLVRHMGDKASAWADMAKKHGLVVADYEQAVSWNFADFIFNTEFDVVSDLTKLRQHGCHHVMPTDRGLLATIARLQDMKIVPPILLGRGA